MRYKNVEIGDAAFEDLPTIVDIYNSTIAGGMVTADTEPVTVGSREKWFHDHSPTFRPLWILRSNKKIAGWLSFQSFYGRPAYNSTAEISIYIGQGCRRRGLGSHFLEEAINQCPRLKIKTLLGFIFGHNKPSIKLFQRHGFKRWGSLPRVAEIDGIERDLIILGRRI